MSGWNDWEPKRTIMSDIPNKFGNIIEILLYCLESQSGWLSGFSWRYILSQDIGRFEFVSKISNGLLYSQKSGVLQRCGGIQVYQLSYYLSRCLTVIWFHMVVSAIRWFFATPPTMRSVGKTEHLRNSTECSARAVVIQTTDTIEVINIYNYYLYYYLH